MSVEIEAKFCVPSGETFARLLSLSRIGNYILLELSTQSLTDHYLDTAEGLMLRGGYACRLRHDRARGTWVAALKGLGGATGAVHQREEFEIAVPPDATPDRWPDSPARTLALALSRAQPLTELFAVGQTRHTRNVYLADRRVAELSLDEVQYCAGDKRVESLELEIELKQTGTLDDLHALMDALSEYDLQPEPRSKFERGLALLPPP